MNSNYTPFDKYFIRTPKEFLQRFSDFAKEGNSLKEMCKQKSFLESIYIASPELYSETLKWLNGSFFSEKEEQKLLFSLYKYLTRMSSRCTPFGLFAGFNLGIIGDSSNIQVLSNHKNKIRHRANRLDMNYACALGQYLAKQESIRVQLNFFPNNSLYIAGDKLRFVEYRYGNKSQRLHQITAVDENEYLTRVLDFAKVGSTIANLSNQLVEDDISVEEASTFIIELINSQILLSELEPQITEPDYWGRLVAKLSSINGCEEIVANLKTVQILLEQLDYQPIGVKIEDYYGKIKEILKGFNIDYEEKFLFQSDMIIPISGNNLDKKIPLRVLEGIELLNKLSISPAENNLTRFITEFNKRYENHEVELTMVLDPEFGLGYPIGNSAGSDLSPLLDGLAISGGHQNQNQIGWDYIQRFLFNKYQETLVNQAFSVELSEEELKNFPTDKTPLPNTISAMVELIPPSNVGEEERIILGSAGGTSALCLIGRFCHTNEEFYKYALEIASKEKELAEDRIIAEIVHLPEARTGNVLMHPVFFEYEIPYLANPNVDQNHTIEISDLMISIRQNKVFLRSKRYNKQVVPRLSNAHSYSNSTLPVYRFLCDLQMQGHRGGVGFHWGNLANDYQFLPRVTYKNLILFEATWNLKKKDIEPFLKIKDDVELSTKVDLWRNGLRLPNLVTLADGDNELLIDFTNIFSIKVLFDSIKKRESFKMKEFLHSPDNSPIKDENGKSYANQIVLAFHKNILKDIPVLEKEKKKEVDLSLN
ncbi:MAG: hypothetical protein EHM93_06275 [Bacteroidales bacterium]|nr:MAG: hypothetical protein EHM93_06275 [Bacteroidales bacterium]